MKRRSVGFASSAKADLLRLESWIAERAGAAVAAAYLRRLEKYCQSFELAAERGHRRDDIRPGLRIVGFEHRIAVAFIVEPEQVIIVRLFHGGQEIGPT